MKSGMRLYGTIINHTLNNTVSYASQLYDEDELKYQSLINDDFKNNIELAQSAIDILNASESTPGSVQYWIKLVIDTILDGAPEAFDTLKEIADWIAQDEHGTAALINRVATNEEAISAINTAISELRLDVESDVQELHLFKTEIRNEVEQDILDAVNDAKAREQEIWTDVSRVDGRVTTVSNKVTEVDNTVKGITDANGNIKYTEALQSVIDTGISNNTAFNNISARWAVLDENQQVLEWMAAGFKSQVSPSTSFASVYAAANQSTSNAISNLTTTVNNLGDTYVAKARLQTEVESIVKNDIGIQSFSEIALDSDVSAAESRMVSRYTTLDNTVGSLSTSLAGVNTKADANAAKLAALATWDGNTPTGYKYTSGLVTESNKDSAIASLFAQGTSSTSKSNIMALITAEVQGEVSSLTLTADKIYLNANETLANTIRATQGTIGGFTIGSDSLYYADPSGRFDIVASETNGPVLSITGSIGAEESHGARLNMSGLTFYSSYRRLHQNVETNKINLDGSGFLSGGALSWDNEGNLTIGNEGSVTFSGTDLKILYNSAAISLNKNNSVRLYTDYMQSNPTNYYEIVGSEGGSEKQLYIRPAGGLLTNDTNVIYLGSSGADIRLNVFGDATVFGNGVGILDGDNSVAMYFDSNKFTIKTSALVNNQWTTPNVVFKEGVTANSFVKQGSSDDYVLLAGGGTKALSDFPSGGGGNYLPLTGGTMTGSINFTSSLYGINFSNGDPNKMGTIYWDPGIDGLHVIAHGRICLDTEGNDVWAEGPLSVSGSATATAFIQSSDETLKNKVADVELTAEQIASAPSIKYTWKDKEKGSKVHIGTTAQYWQDIIPEAVSEGKDGKFGLNYQGLSMTAVISLAKEVVELKAKVAELESKLNS